MQLNFYRVPQEAVEILLNQNLNVYLYDKASEQRQIVDQESLSSQLELCRNQAAAYFQIAVQDIKFIEDTDLVMEIAEINKDLLLYVDRFNSRQEKYHSFFQAECLYLVELSKAFKSNDFIPLANLIQADLANDPQDISVFASTISDCLEKVLRRDSNLSRMLCFSYCCFRHMKYDDRSLLYDFLGAVLFKDLGLSQNQSHDIFQENEIYDKHPYYSLFLLKKLPIELTQTCYFFILDHHEAQDGSGFPKQKMGSHYHPLCDVLKTTEKIFVKDLTISGYLSEMQKIKDNPSVINTALIDCLRITCSYLAG
jgi:hypothetical protein